jgi:hypothetical protein
MQFQTLRPGSRPLPEEGSLNSAMKAGIAITLSPTALAVFAVPL